MFYEYVQNTLIDKSIIEYLKVQRGDIISVAGAGGKTTTIKILTKQLVKNKCRVLITTTTKMFKQNNVITVQDKILIEETINNKYWVFTGKDWGDKIGSWNEFYLNEIIKLADVTLIEADGAKCLPFKFPREKEPIYLDETNKIVYLIGMKALYQPLEYLCRTELLMKFLQKRRREKLTKDDIIKVILSEQGAKKYVGKRGLWIILNQVDNFNLLQEAINIAQVVTKAGVKVAISSYLDE